uniref:Uncharacterized protein MANES_11G036200 n=1 Tax=Rhizophora mucronata TaxID=61149 RepID=A0A2P2LEX4_RHIMU
MGRVSNRLIKGLTLQGVRLSSVVKQLTHNCRVPLHLSPELRTRLSNRILYQPQSLLFDNGALVIEALEDKFGNFLDDADMR